jgi:hypothetical protein
MGTLIRGSDVACRKRPKEGDALRGVAEGLVPNALIFLLLFTSSWVDNHVYDWLALGVLYVGPVVTGLVGLGLIASGRARGRGMGLLLAALATVTLWFVIVWIDSLLALHANTAGP